MRGRPPLAIWIAALALALACGAPSEGIDAEDAPADQGSHPPGPTDTAGDATCGPSADEASPQVIDPGARAGAHAAAGVGPDGRLRVAYADLDTGDLWLAEEDGAGWRRAPVLPGQITLKAWIGRSLAIAVLGDGSLLIPFHHATDQDLQIAIRDTDGWRVEPLDPEPGVGWDVSVALDAQGQPHVAYLAQLRGDLRYARRDGGAWRIEDVDTEGMVGNDPSIAVAPDDTVHLSYYRCGALSGGGCDAGALKHAEGRAGAFELTVVDDEGDAGWYTWLALDSQGAPHVSYCAHAQGQLRYAARLDGAWEHGVVDAGPETGAFSSLALVDGRPWIAYHEDHGNSLRLARLDSDQRWSVTTLDDGGGGAWATMVRRAACGLTAIYHDPQGGGVKRMEVPDVR
jgi:hypothetical protein